MADLNVIKNVLSGSAEYTVSVNAAENEVYKITFDNDVIIDDILVLGICSSVSAEIQRNLPCLGQKP